MKLLWISNAPWMPSGYGSQTRQVGRRIAATPGYEIEFVANDGTRGDQEWEGLVVRGSGYDRYSRDTAREDAERSKADWVVALYNAWVYTEGSWTDPFVGLPNVAAWLPVEHETVPLGLVPWFKSGHTNIAMSRHGYESMNKLNEMLEKVPDATVGPVRFVPHAIEDTFHPTAAPPIFGKPFREVIGVPEDAFLVGIVAANNGTRIYDRKGFGDMALGLGFFMREHKDAYLYMHSDVGDGRDAMSLRMLLGMARVPSDRTVFVDQYLMKKQAFEDEDMAAIYSSFDVLLGTSRGEGFGLPHIEAQACGTPVILSNFSASAELVGEPYRKSAGGIERHPSGWLVPCDLDYDPRQGGFAGKPLYPFIAQCLDEAYERRGDPALREAAIAKGAEYGADTVFEKHWKPLLAEMAAGTLKATEPQPVPVNRAARRQLAKASR